MVEGGTKRWIEKRKGESAILDQISIEGWNDFVHITCLCGVGA